MNGTTDGTGQRSASGVLGWGIYCASSWTWCIGMYLPIIMLRFFGWPGFLVFAIPNLVGLIAFGYLCNARRSRAILREHRPAIRLFSAATVAFQLFFIAWVWTKLSQTLLPGYWTPPSTNIGAFVAVGVWVLALLLAALPDRAWVWLGVVAWLASIGLFIWFLLAQNVWGLTELPWAWRTSSSSPDPWRHSETLMNEIGMTELALLAPAVAFGFLLCPWLDGTFHRARIRSGSPHTFLVFGVTFVPMILFTYAYTFVGMIAASGIVLAQLTVQASFTTAVHVREAWLGGLGATEDRASPWPWAALLPAIAILLGAVPALAGSARNLGALQDLTLVQLDESTYLRFLGLFGLVFPAYALLFITRRGARRPGRVALALFILVIIPCALLFDWAFIGLQTGYSLLAVGILLALAILIHLASRRPSTT